MKKELNYTKQAQSTSGNNINKRSWVW